MIFCYHSKNHFHICNYVAFLIPDIVVSFKIGFDESLSTDLFKELDLGLIDKYFCFTHLLICGFILTIVFSYTLRLFCCSFSIY